MQVRQGWSGETKSGQWSKLDITLDEIDLQRILSNGGWPIPMANIDVATAYQLLDVEATYLLTATLIARHGFPDDGTLTRLDDLKARLLGNLRTLAELHKEPA